MWFSPHSSSRTLVLARQRLFSILQEFYEVLPVDCMLVVSVLFSCRTNGAKSAATESVT